jgi:hypothetical protein
VGNATKEYVAKRAGEGSHLDNVDLGERKEVAAEGTLGIRTITAKATCAESSVRW